jgi:hypothetical protein
LEQTLQRAIAADLRSEAAAQNVASERRMRPRVDAHRTAHVRSWLLDTQNAGSERVEGCSSGRRYVRRVHA